MAAARQASRLGLSVAARGAIRGATFTPLSSARLRASASAIGQCYSAPTSPASSSAKHGTVPAPPKAAATTFEALLRQHFENTGSLAGTAVRVQDERGQVERPLVAPPRRGSAGSGGSSAAPDRFAVVQNEEEVLAELWQSLRSERVTGPAADSASIQGAPTLTQGSVPPPVLESFPIQALLRANVHLGHSTAAAHRHMLPYLLGERNGVHIINLEETQSALRRAVHVVRDVAARGGIILFVGTRPELADIMVAAAGRCAQYHVIHKWVPGTLTNMDETVGRRERLASSNRARGLSDAEATLESSLDNESGGERGEFGSDEGSSSDGALIAQALAAMTTRPDLMILFDPLLNDIALREAQRCNVPTIGLADTNSDPQRLTYPIPANDDSVLSVAFVASVLANAALEGMIAAAGAAIHTAVPMASLTASAPAGSSSA